MREETVGALLVAGSAVGFGTLAIFGKLAESAGLGRPSLLFFRFLVGGVLVWAFLAVRGDVRVLSGRSAWSAAGLGTMYAVLTIAYFAGLAHLTAGLAAVVFFTYPVYVLLLSATFLDEPLTPRLVVSLALALSGLGLVLGGDTAGATPLGVVLLVAAAVGYAVYIVGGRVLTADTQGSVLTAHVLTVVTALLGVRWVALGAPLPAGPTQWGVVLGIGFLGTGVPLVLLYEGLGSLQANRASVLGTAEPVTTVALGVLLLGEPLTAETAAGGGLVLVGVLLSQVDDPWGTVRRSIQRG
ncbi:DMT family transporter [Halogeometricum limi]|uniref:Threonine/homoserine efflux transporter RhtA n=1 Tax=Halogeometricum limi TaxID=555875 RepID=A0A1I6HEX4_9EURY|nr:EamA family transporter [Halogeometricum limi]SFR52890.1 Threonine/homoserine efflux transporter RhtA [Halogeometricum limi]